MSSAREREELVSSIIDLTNARMFEAIVTPDNGHIGCTSSHRTIYQRIPAGEDLLIFEDDCEVLDPSFMEHVEMNKKDYDIIYIGVYGVFDTPDGYLTPSGSCGTHAMWISSRALNAFLNTETHIKEIDHIWSFIEYKHNLRVLRPTPFDRFVRQKRGLISYITGTPR
jgi:hypothetical protein